MDTMSRNMKWALLDTKIKVIWAGGEVSEKVELDGRRYQGLYYLVAIREDTFSRTMCIC